MNLILGRGRHTGLHDGLASVTPLGGIAGSTPTDTTASGGQIRTERTSDQSRELSTTGAACPCRIDTRRTTKYLVDQPVPGSTPVIAEERKWVCEEPADKSVRILCDETNQALAQGRQTAGPTSGPSAALNDRLMSRCGGLSSAMDAGGGNPFSGTVSYGTTQEPKTNWGLILGIGAAALVGGFAIAKTMK
ncbi:MAG TPA: hypothetical protein DIS79_06395 [Bacteroidetes bacterium]|nr:hypothetical protein [Bacteroidota bacterium]HRK04094.1 hypothetical protein [Chlorobiota bacterium]